MKKNKQKGSIFWIDLIILNFILMLIASISLVTINDSKENIRRKEEIYLINQMTKLYEELRSNFGYYKQSYYTYVNREHMGLSKMNDNPLIVKKTPGIEGITKICLYLVSKTERYLCVCNAQSRFLLVITHHIEGDNLITERMEFVYEAI